MSSGLSQEEENYVRISLLLTGISPRAARALFDREFAPACLDSSLKKEYNKLRDIQKKQIINQSQWNLLFPRFPAQISQDLVEWKENDKIFITTRASKNVLKSIKENSTVTITASAGVSKTAILRHVALQMSAEGYDILPVRHPRDIIEFANPNKKTLYVVDDLCGNYSLNQTDMKIWEPFTDQITNILSNKVAKIIVACRLQVYQDEKFESLSVFKSCVCNLLSEGMCMSKAEKKSIAEVYLKSEAPFISEFYDLYDCFPLLWDVNEETRAIIENTCEACKLDRGTSRLKLQDELNSFIHTFLKKEQNIYRTIHDKIFDFLVNYFGQKIIVCLIKNAQSRLIRERFLLEKPYNMNNVDQFISIVPPKYHNMYIQRMIDEWSKGNIIEVVLNMNMRSLLLEKAAIILSKKISEQM
ncbi:Hypothetical predicted protein [Mytilus galloprovincialis]|uniref:Novel STAND NTPase 3 domain-containing protein n=1 Tax=Mytilus galloprovincialis TaxID=29158 RepID=A0A8B6BEJ8_MYTGA|nr:Hypothetical predicted protein [Mytilus galloprovincialis]